MGLSRAAISNYEYGLAALPFVVGCQIAQHLGASQRYLATGQEPARPFIPLWDLGVKKEAMFCFSGTFYEGFKAVLSEAWLRHDKDRGATGVDELTEKTIRRANERQLLRFIINSSAALPEEHRIETRQIKLRMIELAAAELRRRI